MFSYRAQLQARLCLFVFLTCDLYVCVCVTREAGSPFREEITMGILQMQENNRLEILKRRWWEGGQCPREEDHRAKGQSLLSPSPSPTPL